MGWAEPLGRPPASWSPPVGWAKASTARLRAAGAWLQTAARNGTKTRIWTKTWIWTKTRIRTKARSKARRPDVPARAIT